MLKGFKEFVLRGNIIELGVAFVIAAAFTTLVKVLVSAIITPILALFTPGKPAFGFYLDADNPATFINLGVLINAVIVFALTAALVYYLFVLPINTFKDRRAAKVAAGEEEPAPPTDTDLLTEIRDLLKGQNAA